MPISFKSKRQTFVRAPISYLVRAAANRFGQQPERALRTKGIKQTRFRGGHGPDSNCYTFVK